MRNLVQYQVGTQNDHVITDTHKHPGQEFYSNCKERLGRQKEEGN